MRKLKAGTILLIFIVLVSLLVAEFDAPINSYQALSGPSFSHPFGFDSLGRDLCGRMGAGIVISLTISAATAILSIAIGLLISYFMSDRNLSFFMFSLSDSMKLLPTVPLALFLSSLSGPGAGKLIFSMVITMSPAVARTAYSKIAILKKERFTLSSYGLGQSKVKVFFTHILPHLHPYLREQGLSLFLSAVLMEASLSYLGAGLNPGTPSLGAIISEAKDYMLSNPLFLAFPSIALIAISVALALIIKAFSELDSSSK